MAELIQEEDLYMVARDRIDKLGKNIDSIQERITALLNQRDLTQEDAEKLHLYSQSLLALAKAREDILKIT